MSIKQEHAKQTRQDLLNAALTIFSNNGYNMTRLEDIARQAGVTRGAFYWHFKNKTEIFTELQRQILDDLFNSMKDAVDGKLSPLENLKIILYSTCTKLSNDENAKKCGKLYFTFENVPDLKIELNKFKQVMEKTFYSFFSDLIDKGKMAGELRDDLTTKQIYRATAVTLKGTIFQMFDDINPLNKKDIESIINIFMNGIKKQK